MLPVYAAPVARRSVGRRWSALPVTAGRGTWHVSVIWGCGCSLMLAGARAAIPKSSLELALATFFADLGEGDGLVWRRLP
jgi:hypothetical protein